MISRIIDCPDRDRPIIDCLVEAIYDDHGSRVEALVDMIRQDSEALEEFRAGCVTNDALTVNMLRAEVPELFNAD